MAEAVAHWTVTALLTLETAARIEVEGNTEAAFVTDDRGRWLLRGNILLAALRETLAARRTGFENAATGAVWLEALSCLDGMAARGTARVSVRQAGRERETLLPGARFPIRLDLEIPAADAESQILRDLADALTALAEGTFALGEGRRRGMGQCRAAQFRAVRYDLTTVDGWKAWANSGYGPALPPELPAFENPEEALTAGGVPLAPAVPDARRILRLDFDAEVAGTLLVRGASLAEWPAVSDRPERTHLTENGAALLPGTTIAGTLRAGASRIVDTLGTPNGAAQVVALFGTIPGEDGAGIDKGRIRVTEGVIQGAQAYRRTRGRLDPWTGAISNLDSFEEEPCVGGSVRFTVEVRNPEPADIGLLLLLARDLLEGWLPLGGGAAVGRGTLRGKATVTLPEGGTLTLENGAFSGSVDVAELDRLYIGPLTPGGE